ncbi:hypothetical protein ZWY2020_014005 [Hordeum vulgare]|nr:hypothetical protein ZWY2020_014005 [Hordeum vulgare]
MGNCWGAKISSDTSSSSSSSPSGANSRYASRNGAALSSSSSYASAASVQRSEGEILESANVKAFTFNELRTATRNFRPDSVLGEGGFGPSPTKPGTGMVIAVKKLNQESYQGHREWLRLLVYEFMPRGSLENHLFRSKEYTFPAALLNLRMKIAHGAAKGSFLHSDKAKVIYRDFKTSNILLDANYDAKLSDFGLAKDGPTGDKSHVSTRVMGTYGYAAPEYLATGHLTTKSDVYSFGVVLLEMLSGRRAVDKNRPTGEHNLDERQ